MKNPGRYGFASSGWALLLMAWICLASALPCDGAMALLHREMFATTGTLTPGTPGSFSNLTGTFYQRAGGPRLSGGAGASADLKATASLAQFNLVGDQTKIFVGGWFFIKSMESPGTILLSIADQFGNQGPVISDVGSKLGAGILYQSWTECPISPINRWVYFGIGISKIAGSTANVKFYYKLPGGPLQTWANVTAGSAGISTLGQMRVGSDGNPALEYRIGAPSVYTFAQADFSDIAYPADLIEPASGLTWYCNPATGDDGNDGSSPATAWATVEKINEESRRTGMFPAASHAAGDTLVIDTSGAMLDLNGTALQLRTEGLNVKAASGQTWVQIKSFKSLAAAGWSTTGTPNVFATTDTQLHSVVWENDKFMSHPTGGTFAAVSGTLGATPGSFWTDGVTLYLHPFGSTDPRSDGKRYERSYNLEAGAAVVLNALNLHVRDIHAGKTCLAHMSSNDPIGNYCMGVGDAGATLIEHCFLYYGSKHNLGLVGGKAADNIIIDGVQAEQGSPYAGPGGQTVFVSFNGGPSGLGIIHSYRNCITNANAGLIGSTVGIMSPAYPVFYSHNNGGADQFAEFEFVNCDFGTGNLQGSAVETVNLVGTHCGQVAIEADVNLSRCFLEGASLNSAGRTLTARHCIYRFRNMLTKNLFGGTVDVRACTFDASGVTSIQGGVPDSALFSRAGSLSLTFRNNAVVMPAGSVMANVFSNLRSTDTLSFASNAYQLSGSVLSYLFNDGTTITNRSLAQWQALGFDSGSFASTDLKLAAYIPQPGSPLIGAGVNLGVSEDFSGVSFEIRDDIGAYEAPETFAYWQARTFAVEELEDPELTGPLAMYGEDGIKNLVKYALDLDVHQSTSAGLPTAGVMLDGNGAPLHLTLTYNRLRHATDLLYSVEESSNLGSWAAVTSGYEEIIASDARRETVRAVIPVGSERQKFLHLRISQ